MDPISIVCFLAGSELYGFGANVFGVGEIHTHGHWSSHSNLHVAGCGIPGGSPGPRPSLRQTPPRPSDGT